MTRERICPPKAVPSRLERDHPRRPTDGKSPTRRACVGCVAGRARPPEARTPARGKAWARAALGSVAAARGQRGDRIGSPEIDRARHGVER